MTFDVVFDRTVGIEGGYVNDPNDPGGETNWGISKRVYSNVDIKALTRDDAKVIYKRDFWDRLAAEKLPDGPAYQLFDFAVNSGIETAVRALQRAVGVADDGHWGPVSQAATDKMSLSDLVLRINSQRLDFMTRLNNWPTAGRGWARRIAKDLAYGADDT